MTRTDPVFSAIHREFPRTSISKACPFNLIGDPRPTIFFSFSCLAFGDSNLIVNPTIRVQSLLTRSRMSSDSARRKLDLSGLLDMVVAGIQVARERSDRRRHSISVVDIVPKPQIWNRNVIAVLLGNQPTSQITEDGKDYNQTSLSAGTPSTPDVSVSSVCAMWKAPDIEE